MREPTLAIPRRLSLEPVPSMTAVPLLRILMSVTVGSDDLEDDALYICKGDQVLLPLRIDLVSGYPLLDPSSKQFDRSSVRCISLQREVKHLGSFGGRR
jgi:hypothetical protein